MTREKEKENVRRDVLVPVETMNRITALCDVLEGQDTPEGRTAAFIRHKINIGLSFYPNWISVEDELPEQNRWVLTYNGTSINLLMLAGNGGWYDHSVAKHRNVTHWMPLPQPPKKEE